MPSYIYDEELDKMVTSEEFYFNKYSKKAHLQMTRGNQVVRLNYNSDQMEPTRHMSDGKYYSSKAAFRAATKAAGCIEVGNETKHLLAPRKPIVPDRKKRRDDIKKAINDVKYGNVPKFS